MCFCFLPWFDLDAFMHHTMHVGYWTPLCDKRRKVWITKIHWWYIFNCRAVGG